MFQELLFGKIMNCNLSITFGSSMTSFLVYSVQQVSRNAFVTSHLDTICQCSFIKFKTAINIEEVTEIPDTLPDTQARLPNISINRLEFG